MFRLFTLWQLGGELSPDEFGYILTPDAALKKSAYCYDLDYQNYTSPPFGEVPFKLYGYRKTPYQRADSSVSDPVYDDLDINLQEGWIIGIDADEHWNGAVNPFHIDIDECLIFESPDSFCWVISELKKEYQFALNKHSRKKSASKLRLNSIIDELKQKNQRNNITFDGIESTLITRRSILHPEITNPKPSQVELFTSLLTQNISLNNVARNVVDFVHPVFRPFNSRMPSSTWTKAGSTHHISNYDEEFVTTSSGANTAIPFIIPFLSWFVPTKSQEVPMPPKDEKNQMYHEDDSFTLSSSIEKVPELIRLKNSLKSAVESETLPDIIEMLRNSEDLIYEILFYPSLIDLNIIEVMNTLWVNVDYILTEAEEYKEKLNLGIYNENDVNKWVAKFRYKHTVLSSSSQNENEDIVLLFGPSFFGNNDFRSGFEKSKANLFYKANEIEAHRFGYQTKMLPLRFRFYAVKILREPHFVILSDEEKVMQMSKNLNCIIDILHEEVRKYPKEVLDAFTNAPSHNDLVREASFKFGLELINQDFESALNSDSIVDIVEKLQDIVGRIMAINIEIKDPDSNLSNKLDILWLNTDCLLRESNVYHKRITDNPSNANVKKIAKEITVWQQQWQKTPVYRINKVSLLTRYSIAPFWVSLFMEYHNESDFERCKVILFRVVNYVEKNDLVFKKDQMSIPYKKFALNMLGSNIFNSQNEERKVRGVLSKIRLEVDGESEDFISFAKQVYKKLENDVEYNSLVFRMKVKSRVGWVQQTLKIAFNKINVSDVISGLLDAENQMIMYFSDKELNAPLEIVWMNIDFLITDAKKFQCRINKDQDDSEGILFDFNNWRDEWKAMFDGNNTLLNYLEKDFSAMPRGHYFWEQNKNQLFNEGKKILFSISDELESQNTVYQKEEVSLAFKINSMNRFRQSDFVDLEDYTKSKTMLQYLDFNSDKFNVEFADFSEEVIDAMWSNKFYLAIRNDLLIEMYFKSLQNRLNLAFEFNDVDNIIKYIKSAEEYASLAIQHILYRSQSDARKNVEKLKNAWGKIDFILTEARQYQLNMNINNLELNSWKSHWAKLFAKNERSEHFLSMNDDTTFDSADNLHFDSAPRFDTVKILLFKIVDETVSRNNYYDREVTKHGFKKAMAEVLREEDFARMSDYEKTSKVGAYLSNSFDSEYQYQFWKIARKVIKNLMVRDDYLTMKISAMLYIFERPEINIDANINIYILRKIKEYEEKHGVTVTGGPTKNIQVNLIPLRLAGMNTDGHIAPRATTYTTTLKNILTGQYKYEVYEMKDKLKRRYYINDFGVNDKLVKELAQFPLQDAIKGDIGMFFNSSANQQALKDAILGMIRYRCIAYMENARRHKRYDSAVKNFLEGKNPARTLTFYDIPLDGVFLIPAEENHSLIFSIRDATVFQSVKKQFRTVNVKINSNQYFYYPQTSDFYIWVRSHLASYNAALFTDDSVFKITMFRVPEIGIVFNSPFKLGERVTAGPLADAFYLIQKARLESDADVMILSDFEDATLRYLHAFKNISALLALLLIGTGTPAGIATSLLLESASLAAITGQMQITDNPKQYNDYMKELVISLVLFGVGTTGNFRALRRAYRHGKKKLNMLSDNVFNIENAKISYDRHGKFNIDVAEKILINEQMVLFNNDMFTTDVEKMVIEETKNLMLSVPEVTTYTLNPKGSGAGAARWSSRILRHSGYTDVKLNEIGLFSSAHAIPEHHYVVFARKGDVDVAVDLTAGKLMSYGFLGPIFSTKNQWLSTFKSTFDSYPEILVKIKFDVKKELFDTPFSGIHVSFVDDVLPQDNIEILSEARWYQASGINDILKPKLLNKKQLKKLGVQRDKYHAYVNRLINLDEGDSRLQSFNDGKRRVDDIFPAGALERKMSEVSLMNEFNLDNYTPEKRGALSVLIELAHKNRVQSHGLGVAKKYLKRFSHGTVLELQVPQQFIISRLGGSEKGRCFPLSISTAAALSDNKSVKYLKNLMEGENDKIVLQLLDVIHGSYEVKQTLKLVKLTDDSYLGTIDDIFKYLSKNKEGHYYHLKTPTHAMLIGLTEESGVLGFYFYDPNVAFIEYKSFKFLKNTLKRNLDKGKLSKMYHAYDKKRKQALYNLEEIDVASLKLLDLNVDGTLYHIDDLYKNL